MTDPVQAVVNLKGPSRERGSGLSLTLKFLIPVTERRFASGWRRCPVHGQWICSAVRVA